MAKPRIVRRITQFTAREIKALFAAAKRVIYSPFLDMRCASAQQEIGRVLIVASRRVGSAVERNLLKRRIRSIFYEEELYKKPFDWVILARPAVTTLSFASLKALLLRADAACAAQNKPDQ